MAEQTAADHQAGLMFAAQYDKAREVVKWRAAAGTCASQHIVVQLNLSGNCCKI